MSERERHTTDELVRERQQALEEVLDAAVDRAAYVNISPTVMREVAIRIVNFHRVLSKYENETVLDDGDIPDISPIRTRLGDTAKVKVNAAGMGRGKTYRDVPKVDELDFWYLERVANELEAAAKKLGFWEEAKSKTEVFGVDPDWDGGEA